ncbi:hypothetical protein V3W47_10730 [Deinococcus sp. YIM 134068]|uniref:hypothetical protein n=1 Tax=Deinococcus lichenicola TaxID=3118910 RepID=UPI002F93B1AF
MNTTLLLETGADELRVQLRELEADTSPAMLDTWAASFSEKPDHTAAPGEAVNFEGGE